MIYLASPYTHTDPIIRERRHEAVRFCAANLIQTTGEMVYSSIIYAHGLAKAHKLPYSADYWKHFNIDMLRRCDGLLVLDLDGWEQSIGICHEVSLAHACHIPRRLINIFGKTTPEHEDQFTTYIGRIIYNESN